MSEEGAPVPPADPGAPVPQTWPALVSAIAAAHLQGHTEDFDRRWAELAALVPAMPQAERELLNAVLADVAATVNAAEAPPAPVTPPAGAGVADLLERHLPQAMQVGTRTLRTGWDVIDLVLPTGDRVAVLAPATGPRAPLRARRAVRDARAAALTGRCPSCDGRYTGQDDGRPTIEHDPTCRAHPRRLTRLLGA